MQEQRNPQVTTITRGEEPEGSFVYGQRASRRYLDAPADRWLVATNCATEDDEGGWRTILVVHFIHRDEEDARHTAGNLRTVGPVTIIAPAGSQEEPAIAEPGMTGPRDEECRCDMWDDGDPENGPHLAVELNEECPLHGRGTAWAAERGIDYDDDPWPSPPVQDDTTTAATGREEV